MRTIKLCMLGFGNVGRRFCELVDEKEDELAREFGLRVVFTAVGTAGHGTLLEPGGLPAGEVLTRAGVAGPRDTSPAHANGGAASHAHDSSPAHSPGLRLPDHARPARDLIAASRADILVEATTQEAGGGAQAIDHLECAFEHGLDAITVNKGPIAWAYRRLSAQAAAAGRRLRFEGVVMDGTPVFNLADSTLRGCRVLGFDGVLNSTTNYILEAVGEGLGAAEALARVQEQGFAEADPSHDIDGVDAAAKTAALANVLMGADITPDDVARESIREISPTRIQGVWSKGKRLRVVCSALPADVNRFAELPVLGGRGDPTTAGAAVATSASGQASGAFPVRAQVKVVELPPEHAFFNCSGSSSALILHTDLMGKVEIVERDGLVGQTAYAVYSDLLALHLER